MARVIEAEVACDAFLLGAAVATTGAVVLLEELVPTGEGVVPTIEACEVNPAVFEAAAADDPTVGSLKRVVSEEDRALYRVEWSGVEGGVLGAITTAAGTILSGEGRADGWAFTVRFVEGSELSTFLAECVANGVDLDVHRVYDANGVDEGGVTYGLTERQRTALLAALSAGYFDVPRRATQTDLSGELGVAPQSVSELVRRATGELVANTVGTGAEIEESPGA